MTQPLHCVTSEVGCSGQSRKAKHVRIKGLSKNETNDFTQPTVSLFSNCFFLLCDSWKLQSNEVVCLSKTASASRPSACRILHVEGFFLERVGNFLHVERNWTCSSATVYLLRVDFFQTVGTRSVQVYGKSNVFNIWNRSRLHNYRTKSDGLQRLQVAILKIFMSIVSF